MAQGYDNFFKAAKAVKAKKAPNNSKSKKSAKLSQKKSESVEDVLRNALKVRKAKKRKAPFPAVSVIALSLGVVMAGIGSFYPEAVDLITENIEISFLGQGLAKEEKPEAKASQAKAKDQAKDATVNASKESKKNQDNENSTSSDPSYFSKLNERKDELDQRERDLAELEEELHKQKKEIEQRIEDLNKIRTDIAGILKEKVDIDETKVKKLVDFYSNMKPQQAAGVMKDLNEDLAVEVLGRMKKKSAADILNLLEPKKARTLSEKFAGYQRR